MLALLTVAYCTVNPFSRVPLFPPAEAGLTTIMSYVPTGNEVSGHQNRMEVLLTKTIGALAEALLPCTVPPFRGQVALAASPMPTHAPSTKFDPEIVTCWLAESYVTVDGVTEVTDGVGAVTTKPSANVAVNPPDPEGLATMTSYEPGGNEVSGHQNRMVVLFTRTTGALAEALLPCTVPPFRGQVALPASPIPTHAPSTKFDPEIVICRSPETSYVTGDGEVAVTVGSGATTVKASVNVTGRPPAVKGLVT
jgi:hypothetical protein